MDTGQDGDYTNVELLAGRGAGTVTTTGLNQ